MAWAEEPVPATELCIRDTLPGVQREYGHVMAQRAHSALLAEYDLATTEGQQDMARLRSCACRPASMWLDALPVAPTLQLTDADFVYAARYRMGAAYLPTNHPPVTCFCGTRLLPGDQHHALICDSTDGVKTMRHDILKETWRRIAHRAGIATSVEPCMAPLRDIRDRRGWNGDRGDVLLSLPERLTVVDVSVICPSARTYVRNASLRDGSAAAVRDQQKTRKYASGGGAPSAFVPISVESHGRMGKPAMDLLGTIAEAANLPEKNGSATFVGNALRELSVALCVGNALCFRAGLKILARCSGSHFVAGDDRPSADVDVG